MRQLACLALLLLTACNGSNLQCDATEVTDAVLQMANERNGFQNPLFRAAFLAAKLPEATTVNVLPIDAEVQNARNGLGAAQMDCLRRKFEAAVPANAICASFHKSKTVEEVTQSVGILPSSDVNYYKSDFLPLHNAVRDAQARLDQAAKANESNAASRIQGFTNSLKYTVDTIRLADRNEASGAIACAAKIHLNSPKGSWALEVLYSAQLTTDRRVYVQLRGL